MNPETPSQRLGRRWVSTGQRCEGNSWPLGLDCGADGNLEAGGLRGREIDSHAPSGTQFSTDDPGGGSDSRRSESRCARLFSTDESLSVFSANCSLVTGSLVTPFPEATGSCLNQRWSRQHALLFAHSLSAAFQPVDALLGGLLAHIALVLTPLLWTLARGRVGGGALSSGRLATEPSCHPLYGFPSNESRIALNAAGIRRHDGGANGPPQIQLPRKSQDSDAVRMGS